jgi:hypothetical protein
MFYFNERRPSGKSEEEEAEEVGKKMISNFQDLKRIESGISNSNQSLIPNPKNNDFQNARFNIFMKNVESSYVTKEELERINEDLKKEIKPVSRPYDFNFTTKFEELKKVDIKLVLDDIIDTWGEFTNFSEKKYIETDFDSFLGHLSMG